MSTCGSVLVLTDEPRTASAVDSALGSNGFQQALTPCRNLDDLVHRLERETSVAALVDLDPHPKPMLAGLEPIIARFGETRFIVLANAIHSELVLEAMQIGARHFLLKDAIESDLHGVLDKLVPTRKQAAANRHGAAITVLAAGGGCGATTVAVNLAHELMLANDEPALVVDLDVATGMVGMYLGLEGQYGIADVLADPDRIDPDLIRSTAVTSAGRSTAETSTDNVHVLLSPSSINFARPAPLAYAQMERAVQACIQAYPFVVIDAPRVPLDTAAVLVNRSALTLIVFQLTVKDIRFTRTMLSGLAGRGAAVDRVMPLANRCRRRRTMITVQEAQQALGRADVQCVRNDFRAGIRSLNHGQPLARVARRSVLRRDLRQLADRIATLHVHDTHSKGSS